MLWDIYQSFIKSQLIQLHQSKHNMQSFFHESRRSNMQLKVKEFQSSDRRNFVKACNNVCYFVNDDVQLYFSFVDVGFFFKDYVLFGLKLKKKVGLYELVIADSLTTDGPLLPLRDIPSFSKIRRFNQKQKFTGKNKRITLTFEDQESWKLIFKNRDMYYNWMDLLKLAWIEEPLSKSFICKELKRNYEYMIWRAQNPEARSCHFGELLDITATFQQEMKQTKGYIGVNPDEIIGRLICEKRDKLKMKAKEQESQRLNKKYGKILSQIERSIATGIDA